MSGHLLFLTGQLAERQLIRVLEGMAPTPFTWQVHQFGLKVAALMTADMIKRRLTDIGDADRMLVPGRCRGDMAALSEHFGIPVERGPEELMDLPRYFGREGLRPDLSQYDVRIFAEIVDAPRLGPEGIHLYKRDGLLTFEDPFDFFPYLKVEQDGSHAFYFGVELARAQIARQLGKRYVQDQPLRWGCVVPEPVTDTDAYQAPGTTLRNRRRRT